MEISTRGILGIICALLFAIFLRLGTLNDLVTESKKVANYTDQVHLDLVNDVVGGLHQVESSIVDLHEAL